jgi:hypothetical protein
MGGGGGGGEEREIDRERKGEKEWGGKKEGVWCTRVNFREKDKSGIKRIGEVI